jgi:8-oxo-dGTP pyrophosphatase MutT (NUDIX family)
MSPLLDRLLRPFANAAYRLVRKRARSRLGVHAIALTPERRIVLVKLRYAPGWRLPGGAREEYEDPCEAGLRECARRSE